jgi:peptidoglycan/xylan/chitin deacetylase (PgdA/CDA1 family)
MMAMRTARARSAVKTAAAHVLAWSRADAVIGGLAAVRMRPLVVGYHRVVEDFADASTFAIPAMLTSVDMLEGQLDWIGRRFRFASLDELGGELESGRSSSRPLAAVTFDDGYRDVYEMALPILKRKGIPAAVFVVTDVIGTGQVQVHDRLYMLMGRAFARWRNPGRALANLLVALGIAVPDTGRRIAAAEGPLDAVVHLLRSLSRADIDRVVAPLEAELGVDNAVMTGMQPLTWQMLADMTAAGIVVGSHTRSHAWLTHSSAAEVLDQLRGSRQEIARRLGSRTEHFAYPDGCFNTATVAAVAAAGYRFGYTTCTHRDPRFPLLTVPRRMLWERACVDGHNRFSAAVMSCNVHGVFSLVSGCVQDHRS